jgi:hypothetical protein
MPMFRDCRRSDIGFNGTFSQTVLILVHTHFPHLTNLVLVERVKQLGRCNLKTSHAIFLPSRPCTLLSLPENI